MAWLYLSSISLPSPYTQVRLPPGNYFGITAQTGDLSDNHDIYSFKVSDPTPMPRHEMLELQKRIAADVEAGYNVPLKTDPQYADEEPGMSWGLAIFSIVALVAAIIGVFVFLTKATSGSGRPTLPI